MQTLIFLLLLRICSQSLYYRRSNIEQDAIVAENEFVTPSIISCSLKCFRKYVQYDPESGRCLCFLSPVISFNQNYMSFVPLMPCSCRNGSCIYISDMEFKCDCGKLYGGEFCEKSVTNVALNNPANQTSTNNIGPASYAVDGDTGNGMHLSYHCSHTANNDIHSCWQLDFQRQVVIVSIVIYNRIDCCSERLSNASITISKGSDWQFCASVGNMTNTFKRDIECVSQQPVANFLKICNTNLQPLSLCEVIVNGYML